MAQTLYDRRSFVKCVPQLRWKHHQPSYGRKGNFNGRKYQRVLGLLKGEAPVQHHETFTKWNFVIWVFLSLQKVLTRGHQMASKCKLRNNKGKRCDTYKTT